MDKKQILGIIAAIVVLGGALYFVLGSGSPAPATDKPEPANLQVGGGEEQGGDVIVNPGESDSENKGQSDAAEKVKPPKKKMDYEIERLQEFLDSNDNEKILEQAEFLAKSDSVERRQASLSALSWVASPKAGEITAGLLQDPDPDVANDAHDTMEHILSSIAIDIDEDENGELVSAEFDLNEAMHTWHSAIWQASNDDNREQYLGSLSCTDVKFCIPVFLDMAESEDENLRNLGLEYLDKCTNSEGVTNREEARLWLLKRERIKRTDED